ncbi:MAG: zinc ribbon domain-containing protein [Chitinivibrionales bacterium]|nr:zinc ribbon domain-containing protein [Chitinivibrionales bacterium]
MPIFEYRCKSCGHVFDELLRSADSPAPPCPSCGATEPEKLLSVIGGVHMGSTKTSCPSGPSCSSASGGGCRSCPMADA